jgi:hypothetical protein
MSDACSVSGALPTFGTNMNSTASHESVAWNSNQMTAKLLDNSTSNNISTRTKVILPELDSEIVALGRRLYAQFDLLILFINCLSACYSIPAAVSLIPNDASANYNFCDYGPPDGVFVQCPFLESPIFIGFVLVCTIYFVTFVTYKIFRTYEFFTNDLRFYIATDMIVNDTIHKMFVYFGVLFTISGGIAGLAFVFHNGTTDSVGGILTFVFVNLFTLRQIMNGKYACLNDHDMNRLFPVPIYFKLPHIQSTLRLIVTNHADIFDYLLQSMVYSKSLLAEDSVVGGGATALQDIADPILLTQSLETLCKANLISKK